MATEQQQAELFQAETTWFHVFRDMIESGDVARMGAHAVTVYLVIKAHTNFSTGRAFPSIETIVEKSGVSLAQVKRCLATLEAYGYITKEKRGRNNLYTLREKVQITDEHGRPLAAATWDYLPSTVKHAVADLKNVIMTGELSGAKIVHIEKLHVEVKQMVVGNHASPVQINESSPDWLADLPTDLREKVIAARANSQRQRRPQDS